MPKLIYDSESLLDEIETALKASLNTKILEINAEVDDKIDMQEIKADAYFLQELNSKQANYNPIVFYGISSMETSPNGPYTSANISVEILIIFADNGNEKNIPKLAMRYNRALREVMQENWYMRINAQKLIIEDLLPVPYTDLNSSETGRATGIKILTSIA